MTATTPTETVAPAFPVRRIVALVLVGLCVAGLAWLRFGPSDTVSVPAGAAAGHLSLHACTYETEDGALPADCGTLVVPENRTDPGSRLIALPITRIRSTSEIPAEPIFRLEGGPGITNTCFRWASRFTGKHDVVLVGYRGIDGSVRLDCPEVESAVAGATDLLARASLRAYGDAYRACASRLERDGVDLAGYGLVDQAEDLEAARAALGYERIDLVSESAGTRTALIYGSRHPERVHRSVMIGANPPGHFLWDSETIDAQLARFGAHCANDPSCRDRTDDLAAAVRRTVADTPDRWLFLPIADGSVRAASLFGLAETTSEAAPLSAPMTIDSWLSADEGDASGLWFLSLAADLFYPEAFVWGQYAAAGRLDADVARTYFSSPRQRRGSIGYAASAFAWGGGELVDAWPAANGEDGYDRLRPSGVETLVVSGELDVATPPQAAEELLASLPNGRRAVLPGFGHSGSFWNDQPDAGTHLVETYLEAGRVDDSRYEAEPVDFTPAVTHTVLAKGIAAGLAGVPLVALLSLLWMALRVGVRGAYGRKASGVLRFGWPVVLGFGGWFGALLVVLVAMPGVPLASELLAGLSIGIPVGLGVYLGWADPARPGPVRATGLAAAVAGSLVGAWLGFNAASDLVAVLTTIAGAIAGSNLLLIGLDVSRARRFVDQSRREEYVRPAVEWK